MSQSSVFLQTVFPHLQERHDEPSTSITRTGMKRTISGYQISQFLRPTDIASCHDYVSKFTRHRSTHTYMKKTKIRPTAVPASSAADRTSTQGRVCKLTVVIRRLPTPLTIVLGPIRKVLSSDHVLENEADNSPWHVVDCGCWRYLAHAREYKAGKNSTHQTSATKGKSVQKHSRETRIRATISA